LPCPPARLSFAALQVTKLNAISLVSGLAVVVVNWLVTLAVRKVGISCLSLFMWLYDGFLPPWSCKRQQSRHAL
jgi:hypothetical protein